jgi:hypothetical protein
MNTSVILATKTQVVSGHCFKVSFTKAFFKMGMVSPDNVCGAHYMSGSLGQSSSNVWPGNSSGHSGVNGYEAWFITDPVFDV